MYENRRYFKLVSLYFSERAGKPVLFDFGFKPVFLLEKNKKTTS